MVSKGGVPKGRIIPVYLTDEGDVYPIYLHEMGELEEVSGGEFANDRMMLA